MSGTDDRLTPLRGQWGMTGTFVAGPNQGPQMVMDATAQNASRFAITFDAPVNSWDENDYLLTLRSDVESGRWLRTFQLRRAGLCIAVPQGRVTGSILCTLPNVLSGFSWRSTFGEGNVVREWQTFRNVVAIGAKSTITTPNYARRVRVSLAQGGPGSVATVADHLGQIGVVSNLVAPGGQTDLLFAAPDTLDVTNVGATQIVVSVEWEVVS